jgi:FAD/FMN-containing dehydrogenase
MGLVYAKCSELGGDVKGEYGIGYSKKAYLSEEKRSDFKSKKSSLDPKGILNPGKVAD